MKKLFCIFFLILPIFAFSAEKEFTITWKVIDRGDGRFFATVTAPIEFFGFNFAMYRVLKDGRIAFYPIGRNRGNYLLEDVCTEMAPIAR